MVTSLVQFYYHLMLLEWFQNFDMMMLSMYEILCQMSQILLEHLQLLCCPSHSRFLNSLMHLQILSLWFRCSLGQVNHTNQ